MSDSYPDDKLKPQLVSSESNGMFKSIRVEPENIPTPLIHLKAGEKFIESEWKDFISKHKLSKRKFQQQINMFENSKHWLETYRGIALEVYRSYQFENPEAAWYKPLWWNAPQKLQWARKLLFVLEELKPLLNDEKASLAANKGREAAEYCLRIVHSEFAHHVSKTIKRKERGQSRGKRNRALSNEQIRAAKKLIKENPNKNKKEIANELISSNIVSSDVKTLTRMVGKISKGTLRPR